MSDEQPILHQDDVDQVIGRYQKRIEEYGVSLQSLSSGTLEKQRVRHQVHASAIRKPQSSVLDIGCGLGHLYQYLQQDGFDGRYTGYDIVPEYIEACRTNYPGAEFEVRNVFEAGIDDTFDTIILSQVLNNRYRESDNMTVMGHMLRLAFSHTRVSVSIDMLSNFVDYEHPDVFYYDPGEILRIARSITRRVIIRHDYRSFEFCVQLLHDDVAGFVP